MPLPGTVEPPDFADACSDWRERRRRGRRSMRQKAATTRRHAIANCCNRRYRSCRLKQVRRAVESHRHKPRAPNTLSHAQVGRQNSDVTKRCLRFGVNQTSRNSQKHHNPYPNPYRPPIATYLWPEGRIFSCFYSQTHLTGGKYGKSGWLTMSGEIRIVCAESFENAQ